MEKKRDQVINFLIDLFKYKDYLEIGIQYRQCWDYINCENKTGVEPIHIHEDDRILHMNSDQFFEKNLKLFDIVFIDGDHNYEQVIKDIRNAKKFLKNGGSIVLHDSNPPDEDHTNPYLNGTVYKAICEIRSENGWDVCTLNDDHGVCVIREGSLSPLNYSSPDMSFNIFNEKRKEILNLMEMDELKKYFVNI
jgi:hypothetical protein